MTTEKAKKPVLKEVAGEAQPVEAQAENIAPESAAAEDDPFAPENLRLSQDFADAVGVKKLLTMVPVRKPRPQEWFRVHPAPDYRQNVAVIHLKEDQEFFAVSGRELIKYLGPECVPVTLYTGINRQGVLFFWPIRLPDP